MVTLTYGTLPDFKRFETAMNDTFGSDDDDVVRYDIRTRDGGTDDRMMGELTNVECEIDDSERDYTHYRFDAHQLYELCEALAESTNVECNWEQEQCEWAHDFCSSILSTLGFEWA